MGTLVESPNCLTNVTLKASVESHINARLITSDVVERKGDPTVYTHSPVTHTYIQ